MKKTIYTCGLFLTLCPTLSAQLLETFEATPFRREDMSGRGDVYHENAFLHRFSYTPMPYLAKRAPAARNTLQGTAGSVTDQRLYVKIQANKHLPLDGPFFADYQFRRDEDFDGPFTRNLLGIGIRNGNWLTAFRGDVETEKARIDFHGDVVWENEAGDRFRLTWIAPDALLNEKDHAADFDVTPHTFFTHTSWGLPGDLRISGFGQVNTLAVVDEKSLNRRTRSLDHFFGGGLEIPLKASTRLEFLLESLRGERHTSTLTSPRQTFQDLNRDYESFTLEFSGSEKSIPVRWVGLRHLRFHETRSPSLEEDADYGDARTETLLYFGNTCPITERLWFAPTVFINYQELELRQFTSRKPDYESNTLKGKLSPVLDLLVNQETGARIRFVANINLHRVGFAGGNIQVFFPY